MVKGHQKEKHVSAKHCTTLLEYSVGTPDGDDTVVRATNN